MLSVDYAVGQFQKRLASIISVKVSHVEEFHKTTLCIAMWPSQNSTLLVSSVFLFHMGS